MAETARNCNRIFTLRRCLVRFRMFKKGRGGQGGGTESGRIFRFPTAGTRVASGDEKLNQLADPIHGRAKMFSGLLPSPEAAPGDGEWRSLRPG